MGFLSALVMIGLSGVTNCISQRLDLSKKKFKKSRGYKKLKKKCSSSNHWGIYADNQVAAKALAVVLCARKGPEVHGRGYYGHYHDKKHLLHIWYGKKQYKPYDKMAMKEYLKLR